MIRIGFYNHTGTVSGAERMLLLTIDELQKLSEYSLFLLCPESGTLREEVMTSGVSTSIVKDIHSRFTYNPLKILRYFLSMTGALRQLRRATVREQPDCIHANSVRAGMIATLATVGTGLPIIWHVHDMLPEHPVTWALRLFAHSSCRLHVVACSRAAAATFKPFFGRGRPVRVIHNAVKTERLPLTSEARDRKRLELKIHHNDFLIGSVGMISERKDQRTLIRAIARLQSKIPNVKLILVGSPLFNKDHLYLNALTSEIASLGLRENVILLGNRKDVPDLMQAMDVFVLHSVKEPFGLVLLEAMAAGTPVISTDSGGPRELIRSGHDGILVPVGDARGLADQLHTLFRFPEVRRKYAANAQRLPMEFSSKRYIESWDKLYREVTSLSQHHSGSKIMKKAITGSQQ